MSVSKKRKEVHRDSQARWKPLELFGVLTYLNDNFDIWYENHVSACGKAIDETNINRDDRALYNKIHTMIKAVEDYIKEGKKSTSCAIMWEENNKIYDLVKGMYDKTQIYDKNKEKKIEENQETSNCTSDCDGDVKMKINNTTTTNQIDVPQIPFTIETINKIYNEQIQNYDRLVEINRDMIERRNKEVRDLHEQISQRQIELIDLIQKANGKLEELKKFTGKTSVM